MNFGVDIPPFNMEAAFEAKSKWNRIAKPLGSLGLLEGAVTQIAGLTGDANYAIGKRAAVVMCADNGVVKQGVTQTGSEVTAVVAKNMTTGDASVCKMAEIARADVIPVDMGMLVDLKLDGLLDCRVAAGTADITAGPAMTREQAIFAIQEGIAIVKALKDNGYNIIATGEMGIGNTTTSSAMASVLINRPPGMVTGRGAGLTAGGLSRKIDAVRKAIKINAPDKNDALDILAKLGGFDIAGLAGVFIGGAVYQVPIIIDGLISSVAALTAMRMCPSAKHAMLASHMSNEPCGSPLLKALAVRPVITAGMYLGEGTGAVALLPLLDMAYAVFNGMCTFEEINIDGYMPLK